MDLRALRHFVSLARRLSFVAAAEELHLTQPALSRSIRVLEEELELKLIERHRSGCSLTPAGALLARDATAILDQAVALRHNLSAHARGDLGHLRFGAAPIAAALLLGKMLAEATRTLPGLTLAATLDPVPELVARLRRDAIEFFLCSEPQLPSDTGLAVTPLGYAPLAWLARAGHPLAGGRGLRLEDTENYPFVSVGSDFGAAREGEPDVLFGRTVTIRCDDYRVLLDTVRRCDAICLASPSVAAVDEGIIQLDIRHAQIPPQTNLVSVHRAARTLSPMAEALLGHAKEIATLLSRERGDDPSAPPPHKHW